MCARVLCIRFIDTVYTVRYIRVPSGTTGTQKYTDRIGDDTGAQERRPHRRNLNLPPRPFDFSARSACRASLLGAHRSPWRWSLCASSRRQRLLPRMPTGRRRATGAGSTRRAVGARATTAVGLGRMQPTTTVAPQSAGGFGFASMTASRAKTRATVRRENTKQDHAAAATILSRGESCDRIRVGQCASSTLWFEFELFPPRLSPPSPLGQHPHSTHKIFSN